MNSPRQNISGLILSLAVSFTVSAQDTAAIQHHEFSIQQAVDYAKKNNMQVKNALLSVQVQKEVNKEITAAAYPQVNGNFSYVPGVPPKNSAGTRLTGNLKLYIALKLPVI